MARYDKYEPKGGGFRAELAADWTKNVGNAGGATGPIGVGLNADGRVVAGGGATGVVGVLVLTRDMKARDVVDVMTDGELVEFGGTPGTVYYAAAGDGVISTTNTGTRIGHTVEGSRCVVRVAR